MKAQTRRTGLTTLCTFLLRPAGSALSPDASTRSRRLILALLAGTASSLLLAPQALALNGPSHQLTAIFGSTTSSPPNPYPLVNPTDVEVDQSTGDVYVTDPSNHRVEKFNENGEFLLMFGGDVNSANGADVCTRNEACQPGTPGSAPGQFVTPTYLAVDNSPGGQGDVYVADTADGFEHNPCSPTGQNPCLFNLVQKFSTSGHIIASWGVGGQKDGADATDLPVFGPIFGVAVDASGHLYVGGSRYRDCCGAINVWEYTQGGKYIPTYGNVSKIPWLKVGPAGGIHAGYGGVHSGAPFALDPLTEELYKDTGTNIEHSSAAGTLLDSFGAEDLSGAEGIAIDGSHAVYVANAEANDVVVLEDVRPEVTTGPPSDVDETSLTFTGYVDPETNQKNHGPITKCRFEWGFSTTYGHSVPCVPDPETGSHFVSKTAVTATLSGLTPITDLPFGTTYHYRLIASNEKIPPNEAGATGEGQDEFAFTTAPPQIEGISSSHLTATSAELDATIKPNGLATTYHFEYGTTPAYGQISGEGKIEGDPKELAELHKVAIPIEGLQRGATYHFRLVAENNLGEATSEDQTFEFFPPNCPNAAARQQTSSAYLPDCRAYELVSPGNANGTILSPGGPNTGQATSPSRLSFTGAYSALPGANTIETTGDLYVATRTDAGWVSRYIGLPGDQAGCMGGPPTAPNAGDVGFQFSFLTNTILTDPSMSHFLSFIDGAPILCEGGEIFLEGSYKLASPSGAPYLFRSDGALEGRLPTNLDQVPGALEAFRCPYEELSSGRGECSGETTASGDLTHLIFSSRSMAFAEGGLTAAPGSAYDDDLATGEVTLISKLPDTNGGGNVTQDPSFATFPPKRDGQGHLVTPGGEEEFIRFPAVSTDGSHILMATATAGTESCANSKGPYGSSGSFTFCPRFTETPIHLYMRVNDETTYEIAESPTTHEPAAVNYVGMTADGSKVFFTSAEQLITGEETGTNTELYLWSQRGEEEGHPLTLISKPNGGADDTEECDPALVINGEGDEVPWTANCNAVPVSTYSWSNLPRARGGNGISDTAIASQNGDIYFYSPAQLDGNHGVLGGQNLYDYRDGRVQFVTTLGPEEKCGLIRPGYSATEHLCVEGPIVRIDVSSEDTHMAFLTASRLTSYDNAGYLEMYFYTPATGAIVCVSCNPSGKPATADVEASQDGLFMTDDGRTLFSTIERLVPRDTNEGVDVYEFTSGRPQLITPGTGTGALAEGESAAGAGLVGVSANGTDVYFSTFDTLISEDHNGNFLKFYDARSGGGFPRPPPAQPCAAAEECHGPGTEAPRLPTQATVATLIGGNANSGSHKHHRKKRHKKARSKHRHGRPSGKRGSGR